jgi:hypothetical protein
MQNVRKVVSEADGYQPHLIAPENGYRRLIESSLLLFRGPAEAVVDATHFILRDLVRKAVSECTVSTPILIILPVQVVSFFWWNMTHMLDSKWEHY